MRTIFDDAPGTLDGITFVNAFNIDEAWKAKMAPIRAHLDHVAGSSRMRLAAALGARYDDRLSRISRQVAASTSVTFGRAIAAQLDASNAPMRRFAAQAAVDVAPTLRMLNSANKTRANTLAKAWTPTHTAGLQKLIATTARQAVGAERLRAAFASAVPKIGVSWSATTVIPRLDPSLLEDLRRDDYVDPAILRPTTRRQINVTINGGVGALHLGASVNYSYNQNIHDVTNSVIGQGHNVNQTQHNYPANTDDIVKILGLMNEVLATITNPRQHEVLQVAIQDLGAAAATGDATQVEVSASRLRTAAKMIGATAATTATAEGVNALVSHADDIARIFGLA